MKPATHAHLATRLDLLEQKFEAFEPSEGGGGEVTSAQFERLFDRVLGWSYAGPHGEEAIQSPPSANTTVYDAFSGYNGYSMQRALFGSHENGGFSDASLYFNTTVSLTDATFGGASIGLADIVTSYGGLAGWCQALAGQISTINSRLTAAGIP